MGGGPIHPVYHHQYSSSSSDDDGDDKDKMELPSPQGIRINKTYHTLCNSYVAPHKDLQALRHAKNRILSHKPGDWIGEGSDCDFDVPQLNTLLLVGPRGSGKTTLVNRIVRVFDRDDVDDCPPSLSSNLGQVSHNPVAMEGTLFLSEYLVPKSEKKLCVYDTRSLCDCRQDNYTMIWRWMTEGVSDGEMVTRESDSGENIEAMKIMARMGQYRTSSKRTVNFAIFVVSGISILESMDGNDKNYEDMLIESFGNPFLSFKDNRPAIVVTHGDLISSVDRALVRTYLGELLGIPPVDQIFDIPGKTDYDTEFAIMELLQYSIKQSDRNLASTPSRVVKSRRNFNWVKEQLPQLDLVIISLCVLILVLRIIMM